MHFLAYLRGYLHFHCYIIKSFDHYDVVGISARSRLELLFSVLLGEVRSLARKTCIKTKMVLVIDIKLLHFC